MMSKDGSRAERVNVENLTFKDGSRTERVKVEDVTLQSRSDSLCANQYRPVMWQNAELNKNEFV